MVTLSGGSKLKKRLAELAKKIEKPATLRVGFLEDATYPDGRSVAMVAAANEFGTSTIPPRPFFRDMIAAKSPGWGDAMSETLKAADYDAEKALKLMGEGIKGQLQQSITDFTGVPLKPATIKAKGFDKQLIETSHMLNSVDYDVQTEGEA